MVKRILRMVSGKALLRLPCQAMALAHFLGGGGTFGQTIRFRLIDLYCPSLCQSHIANSGFSEGQYITRGVEHYIHVASSNS